jgi:hypothetical protein
LGSHAVIYRAQGALLAMHSHCSAQFPAVA